MNEKMIMMMILILSDALPILVIFQFICGAFISLSSIFYKNTRLVTTVEIGNNSCLSWLNPL